MSGNPPFYGRNDQEVAESVARGKIDFSSSEWSTVSEQAKELIQQLLSLDPSRRPTAHEALEHTWLQNKQTLPAAANLADSFHNLRKFRADEKLQKAVLAFISVQLSSREEINMLTQLFQSLDKNQDGRLSKEELLEGYVNHMGANQAEEEVEKIMKEVDTDGNGYLEYSEFLIAALKQESLLSRENLDKAFNMFDSDGSGSISASELRAMLGADVIATDQVWKELIDRVDQNGDGEIDLKEFKAMMLKAFNT